MLPEDHLHASYELLYELTPVRGQFELSKQAEVHELGQQLPEVVEAVVI